MAYSYYKQLPNGCKRVKNITFLLHFSTSVGEKGEHVDLKPLMA